jgi:acetylornithine/succinyldiaminopimelate/putrescine aminotransferase
MNTVDRMPFTVVAAEGHYITTSDGRRLFDMWNDEGVNSLGWNTGLLLGAIMKFFGEKRPHQLADIYPNDIRSQCADMLCQATRMDRVFFANSGTESYEAAVKLARKHHHDRGTGKRSIATLAGNFHGRTGFAMAASDASDSPYHKIGYDPMPEGFYVVESLDQIKVGETCAFSMATILGNNVVHTYSREWLLEVRKFCSDNDILLIFDEIQVGMGRTGDFTAWHNIGGDALKPDIMTMGKGMAAGFPMAACLAKEHVAVTFTPGTHFSTFAGSPFACWMNTLVLEYLDEHMCDIRDRGNQIREEMKERVDQGWINEFDGMGIHWAFTPDWDAYDGFQFCEEMIRQGVVMATWRKHGPIRFCPPLNISEDELSMIFDAMDRAESALRK